MSKIENNWSYKKYFQTPILVVGGWGKILPGAFTTARWELLDLGHLNLNLHLNEEGHLNCCCDRILALVVGQNQAQPSRAISKTKTNKILIPCDPNCYQLLARLCLCQITGRGKTRPVECGAKTELCIFLIPGEIDPSYIHLHVDKCIFGDYKNTLCQHWHFCTELVMIICKWRTVA